MSNTVPLVTLNSGYKMPSIGLGTYLSKPGEVGNAVKVAINAGYRHIDCASLYQNQKEIGSALTEVFQEGKVKREEMFITSKLWNAHHSKEHVRDALLQTLKDLNLSYLDLYLIHWPIAFKFTDIELTSLAQLDENGNVALDYIPYQETYRELEKLVEEGLVRSIGVSNVTAPLLLDILSYAKIVPAVNQVEAHPYLTQPDLLNFLNDQNIVLTAYAPLAQYKETSPVTDEVIKSIATKYKKTPTQIVIKWAIERGTTVIPKSVTPSRIEENFNIFDFSLTKHEVESISNLNKNHRVVNPKSFFRVDL